MELAANNAGTKALRSKTTKSRYVWRISMKKFLLGTVGLIAMAGSASAADLGARPYAPAPVYVQPVYDWSGFYIGANAGWGSSHNCWNNVTSLGTLVGAEGCHDATGAVAGGQLGYRWQAGGWVFGLEGQGNWADLSGSNISALSGGQNRSRIDSFGLFTGQIGYAWNNALLYVKGGGAVTDSHYDVFVAPGGAFASGSGDQTNWGAALGAGVEFGFAQNWTAGIEYDHLFMGDQTVNFFAPGNFGVGTDRVRQDVDLVTVRVNYRWGGPIIQKY
jgi:outer membrane immunogenic protein